MGAQACATAQWPDTWLGLFLIYVVSVALNMASSTLQGRGWLKNMPERFGTGLTVGGKVVECRNELMAFVVLKICFFSLLYWFHL